MKTRLMAVIFAVVSGSAFAQSEPPLVTDEQAVVPDAYPQDQQAQQQYDQQQYDQQQQAQPAGDQDSYGYVEASADPNQAQVNMVAPSDDAEPVEMNTVASVQAFEPSLAPYGDWVASNGVRAWRPSPAVVGNDFVPYASSGQWVSTEAGWSFSSSLPFGWATFHYGRWWYDPSYGWVWIPDTTWGPSWVEWRYGGGYAGWAPLAPLAFQSYYRPRWYFVQSSYLCSRNLNRYAVPFAQYNSVYGVTVGVPTRHYRGQSWHVGPSWRDVARISVERPIRRSMVYDQPRHVAVNVGGYGSPSGGGYRGGSHVAVPPPATNGGFIPPPRGSPVPPPRSGNYGNYGNYGNGGHPATAPSSSPPPATHYSPPPASRGPGPSYSPPPAAHYSSPPSYSPPPHSTSAPAPHYSPPPVSHPSAPPASHTGNSGHRH
jgi:hypothetical protein